MQEYEFHEEAKCADASGVPCQKQTIGLLSRRHVVVSELHFIGKESNRLEEVEEQNVLDPNEVYTEYPDPRRERQEWAAVVAGLGAMTKRERQNLAELADVSVTTIEYTRRGRIPHSKNRSRILKALYRLTVESNK